MAPQVRFRTIWPAWSPGHVLALCARVRRSALMRIALVSEYYFPHLGGVTEHVHNLATVLNQWGHQAIVITGRMAVPPNGEEEPDPAWVHRVGTSRVVFSAGSFARVTSGWRLRRQIREILERERIDLVHVHGGLDPVLSLVGAHAAREVGVPV